MTLKVTLLLPSVHFTVQERLQTCNTGKAPDLKLKGRTGFSDCKYVGLQKQTFVKHYITQEVLTANILRCMYITMQCATRCAHDADFMHVFKQ